MAGVFIRRQQQLDAPLIDLTLFRSRAFSLPLAIYLVATFVAFGAFLFIAQYLQLVFGLSPLRAGLWLLPSFAGYIIGSILTAPISERVSPRVVLFTAMLLAAGGFALLLLVPAGGLLVLAIGTFAYSIGLAPVVTLATDAIVGAAPAAQAGIAAAISETSSELGGALGIALLGSFGTAIYRWRAGAPRGTAAETLSGAISLAARLDGTARADLLRTARAAFTDAFAMTALVCGALVLVTAFAARRLPASPAGRGFQ
jgi:DHA2 family multidrug resistance protein-like MFS transporter